MVKATKQLVIFLGPPGSGKGSLSQLCVENFGWKQLSTGYLCRKHIKEQTEIGKQIDFLIKSGKLISDKLIIDMVEQWLQESMRQSSFIILDGFPRNIAQAEAFHEIIDKKLSFFKIEIFKLFVSDEIVVYIDDGTGLVPDITTLANDTLNTGGGVLGLGASTDRKSVV